MDRLIRRRITFHLVAVAFGILLPFVAHSEEVLSVQPQLAPAEPGGAAGSAAVKSNCFPNYCGTNRQSVYLDWHYPSAKNGTETWYVKGLPPSLATYTIVPPKTTGALSTAIQRP